MIRINFKEKTYVCPYCGTQQSFDGRTHETTTGYMIDYIHRSESYNCYDLVVNHIVCCNSKCKKISIIGLLENKKQIDILPTDVCKEFPNYVPKPIRDDYREAVLIIEKSPKASATLLRRCLQGMIRDFWGIKKSRLFDEINELKGKIPSSQWFAIDGLRKIGNIGAHMENDINTITEVDEDEAMNLAKLIELLIDKWYVARHDEINNLFYECEA